MDAPTAIGTDCLSHADTHVTWDEETIARHDLDRGTRMKIDEPDTPYHCYAEGDDIVSPARSLSGRESQPSIQWDELHSKLQDVKDSNNSEGGGSNGRGAGAASGSQHFGARDEEGRKDFNDLHFAEKRKMHYNEFERLRAWKMQHEDDDGEHRTKQRDGKTAGKSFVTTNMNEA